MRFESKAAWGRTNGRVRRLFAGSIAAMVGGVTMVTAPAVNAQERVPISVFASESHIHGLAVDPIDPAFLLVATHYGLFRAGEDGFAERISVVQDFMSFSSHPTNPFELYASGHPAGGGNLGFIVSNDGGADWVQRSAGVNGPVDFHLLAISSADTDVIYGTYGSLQVSRDGGASWSVSGTVPEQAIDLAASAADPDTLYAATASGLFVSFDSGANWQALIERDPVSLVEISPNGRLYAFVLGKGLFMAIDEDAELSLVGSDWLEPYLTSLAFDPYILDRMFAVTRDGRIVGSLDGGRNWSYFGE